jgi:hypothetical protein
VQIWEPPPQKRIVDVVVAGCYNCPARLVLGRSGRLDLDFGGAKTDWVCSEPAQILQERETCWWEFESSLEKPWNWIWTKTVKVNWISGIS